MKAAKTDTAIGKCPIGQTPFFQEEEFSFFEGNKLGPTIITLLPLNHRIDFCGDSELQLLSSFAQLIFVVNCYKSLQPYVLLLAKLP